MNPGAAQSQRFDRHYRIPAARVWVGRTLMVLYALCAVPFLISSVAVVGVVLLAVVGAIDVWMERLFLRGGMYETDAGLKVVTGWGSKLFSWEHIATFRQSPTTPHNRVLVVRSNGVVAPIGGTSQGARVRWRGGETRDIVAVLNARLDEWRSTHPRPGY